MSYRQKEDQLGLMCWKLADIIQQDASIVRRAKDHINRLLKEDQGAEVGDLEEWRNILDTYSIQRLVNFVVSSSERPKRLRQSNPFFAILLTRQLFRSIELPHKPASDWDLFGNSLLYLIAGLINTDERSKLAAELGEQA